MYLFFQQNSQLHYSSPYNSRDKNSLNVWTAQVFQVLTHNYMTFFSQYEAENMSTWKYMILNFLFQ